MMYSKEHYTAFEKCAVEENDMKKGVHGMLSMTIVCSVPMYTFLRMCTFYLKKKYRINVLKD